MQDDLKQEPHTLSLIQFQHLVQPVYWKTHQYRLKHNNGLG